MVKNKKLDVPLSGYDLKDLFLGMQERPNIVLMNDIKPHWGVQDIFKGSGHATLFIEHEGQNIGHWVACILNHAKDNKTESGYSKNGHCYYFDSLGDEPPKQLVEVLLKSYPKVLYNDRPYQKDHENSCGRWALAVSALNKLGLNPYEIEKMLDETKDVNKFIIETFR